MSHYPFNSNELLSQFYQELPPPSSHKTFCSIVRIRAAKTTWRIKAPQTKALQSFVLGRVIFKCVVQNMKKFIEIVVLLDTLTVGKLAQLKTASLMRFNF